MFRVCFIVEYKRPIWPKRGQYWFWVVENEKDFCQGDDVKAGLPWRLAGEMKGQSMRMGMNGMCSGNVPWLRWSTGCVAYAVSSLLSSFSQQTSVTYLVPTMELGCPPGIHQLLHGQSWKGLSNCPHPKEREGPHMVPMTYDPLAYLKYGSRTYLKFHIPLTKVWNFRKYKEQVKIVGPDIPSLSSLRASLFCFLSKDDLRSICHIFCPFLGLRSPLLSPVREFGSDADFFLFWNCPVITDFNGINARPKLEIQE